MHLESFLGALEVTLDAGLLDRIDEIVPPGTNVNPADAGYVPPSLADASLRRRLVDWRPGFDPEAQPVAGARTIALADGRVVVDADTALAGEPLHVGWLDDDPVFVAPLTGTAPADAPTLRALLAEAGWFGPTDERRPPIPPPFTIAHRLITGAWGRRYRAASAITKTAKATLITPFIVKKAVSSRRRSCGWTSACSYASSVATAATPSQ